MFHIEAPFWLIFFALAVLGCDLPPDDIIDGETTMDAGSSETETVDTDTDTVDADTGEPEAYLPDIGTSCISAMMCIAVNPADTLGCISGLNEDDAAAAGDLAFCVLQACPDAINDLLEFGSCLITSCSEEAMSCVGFSPF